MEEKKDTRWYGFMAKDEFVVFMNIVRILSFILVAILIFVMVSNIEEVKLLASDPCQVCAVEMEGYGVVCTTEGFTRTYNSNGTIEDKIEDKPLYIDLDELNAMNITITYE